MKFSLLLMTAAVSALAVSCAGQSANNAPQATAPVAPATNPVAGQPAVAAPTPTAAPAPAASETRPYTGADKTLYVITQSGGSLNLRASASSNAAIVGSLPYRSAVAPYAEDMSGQWYQVTAENGQRGWVSASYVTRNIPAPVAAAPTPAPAAPPATGGGGSYSGAKYRTVNISSGTLNLRSGPHTSSPVIGSLANGEGVQVIVDSPDQPGWTRIATRSGEGWVANRYLR